MYREQLKDINNAFFNGGHFRWNQRHKPCLQSLMLLPTRCTQAPLLTVVNDCRYFIYTINQERFGMRIDFAKSLQQVMIAMLLYESATFTVPCSLSLETRKQRLQDLKLILNEPCDHLWYTFTQYIVL